MSFQYVPYLFLSLMSLKISYLLIMYLSLVFIRKQNGKMHGKMQQD